MLYLLLQMHWKNRLASNLNELQVQTNFSSNRIRNSEFLMKLFNPLIGLDPALPFFATARQNWKLDMTDAIFVDVIHTNAGVYGKLESCGHVDFYMVFIDLTLIYMTSASRKRFKCKIENNFCNLKPKGKEFS